MVRLLSQALGIQAWAGFDEAVAAYTRGDYATAVQELLPMAQQGNARAQYNLGVMYANGQGISQDSAQAAQWYRQAAEQGYATAQYNLGVMYASGLGVSQDDQQGYFWFSLAAGSPSPGQICEDAVHNRDRTAARLTPAQLAATQSRVRTWQPKPETPVSVSIAGPDR
jgi:TPR repeat protein